ncbi:unnamed protein product [Sphagnum balticum]
MLKIMLLLFSESLGVCANHLQKGGSLADYALAPITSTVKRPPTITPVEGASVPVTGLPALQRAKNMASIRLDGSSNLNVLITAALVGSEHYMFRFAFPPPVQQ